VVAVSSAYDGDTGSSRAVYRLQEANPGLTLAVAYVVGNPAASNQHPVGTTYASGMSKDESQLNRSDRTCCWGTGTHTVMSLRGSR